MSYLKKFDYQLVACPFNSSHRVLESRLQYHITKCMKNYPNYVLCPYNSCHQVKKEDQNNHILNCSDKKIGILYHNEKCETEHTRDLNMDNSFHFETGENWDND